MHIKKAYKFRLKPNDQQRAQLWEIAGSCRFVWNKVVALNAERLASDHKLMWYQEADFWTKLWKRSDEYTFLKIAPAHCIQQTLRDLDRAYRDAFDKTQPNKRLPRLHKRSRHNRFRFPEPKHITIDNRRIKLPKLGWLGFHKSSAIDGEIRNVTVSEKAGAWYVSIQVQIELPEPVNDDRQTLAMGLDLGIKHFVASSSGELIQPVNASQHYADKLARLQRQLARKVKFSANWQKLKAKIGRCHQKISAVRHDFLHKLSTTLSKSHAMIVVEDLKVSNMSRSAARTVDNPGKQVSAKSGLNKAILDQGWAEFCRQLGYKLSWRGGELLKVAPQYTSQRCHQCQHMSAANRVSQGEFVCERCGHAAHADINAARNILAAGHAVLACGETGLPDSMKQELLGTSDLIPA